MRPLLLAPLLAMVATAAWGQGNTPLRARELFYTPPPDATAAKPQAPAPVTPRTLRRLPRRNPRRILPRRRRQRSGRLHPRALRRPLPPKPSRTIRRRWFRWGCATAC